jgi:hypothetical protein
VTGVSGDRLNDLVDQLAVAAAKVASAAPRVAVAPARITDPSDDGRLF